MKRLFIFSVLFILSLLFLAVRPSHAQNACTIVGDLNGDGHMSLTDYEYFRRTYSAGITPSVSITQQPGGAGAKIPANPKIMPLGDSITVGMHGPGADWTMNHSLRGGYRQKLEELLTANGTAFDFVGSVSFPDETLTHKNHEGHGGWCISGGNNTCWGDFSDPGGNAGLLAHIDGWMSTYQPDVVLLNIGTNDFNGGQSANVLSNYSQLIDKITTDKQGVFLFISSINIEGDPSIPGFNSQLQTLAQQKAASGKNVFYVDVWANMTPPLHEGTDTLHPTLPGYEVMGQNWFNALKPHLN